MGKEKEKVNIVMKIFQRIKCYVYAKRYGMCNGLKCSGVPGFGLCINCRFK